MSNMNLHSAGHNVRCKIKFLVYTAIVLFCRFQLQRFHTLLIIFQRGITIPRRKDWHVLISAVSDIGIKHRERM